MAITYASTTNVIEHLELQIQLLSTMKQQLVANDKTNLVNNYTDVIAALTADKATVEAATFTSSLQS